MQFQKSFLPLFSLAASLFFGIPNKAAAQQVLWSTDNERGNLSEWRDYGGGEYNLGSGNSQASQDVARSGAWSVKMTITPGNNATMMYPWLEAAGHPTLNYTVWYYFPERYSPDDSWNVMHWGSRSPTRGASPFYTLNVGSRPDGSMFFYVSNWRTGETFPQAQRNIQVGQWVRVDAQVHCTGDNSGSVTVWQDGAKLFELADVQTRYRDGDCAWSVNNYSDDVRPSPTTIYVDDVSISSTSSPQTSGDTTSSGISPSAVSSAISSSAIWSANHETGDDSQWYFEDGGGQFNSGIGSSAASRDEAHNGSYSLKMTINTSTESGTRMFRWNEPRAVPRLRYSAWFYFPQNYSVRTYWNVFQWKSRRSGVVDPFFVLNIGNRGDGEMYFYLYNWQTRQAYSQSAKNIPVGRWIKIDAYYHCSGSSGRVSFWQDGTLLFDVPNVRTAYSDYNCEWSLDNYSNGLSPSPATIYMDDASIVPE